MHLFGKIHDQLNDNGIFVLEYQDAKSYNKSKRMTETTKENFKTIQLKPDDFLTLLRDEIGFRLINTIEPPNTSSKGFDRPIHILQKVELQ